jgi:hypothetical protein
LEIKAVVGMEAVLPMVGLSFGVAHWAAADFPAVAFLAVGDSEDLVEGVLVEAVPAAAGNLGNVVLPRMAVFLPQ